MKIKDVVKVVIEKASKIKKGDPTGSSVHVNAPLGSEEDKIRKNDSMIPPIDNLEASMIAAAFNPSPMETAVAAPVDPTKEGPVAKAELTTRGREHIKETNFALPEERKYPIHDIAHARNALARVAQHGTPEEKKKVEAAVHRKYPSLKSDVKKEDARRVATVAVKCGDHLLMGKRRDNGKWTMPGGHVDKGEDMHQGALRELHEETGIKLKKLHPITEIDKKKDLEGKPLHVQAFHADLPERPSTSMLDDPDGEVYRWKWVDVSDGIPDEIKEALHVPAERNIALKALGLVEKDEVGGTDEIAQGHGENSLAGLFDMQQLISGMDYELGTQSAANADEAREIALDNLSNDPTYYRKIEFEKANEGAEFDPESEDGLKLDLGSGQTREKGHIGLDLYPYDHGTIVHDLHLGVPFPDESAENVRMVNSLDSMDDLSNDPKPLLAEIQRVLMPGGQFHYEGPNEIYNYPEGLEETLKEAVDKDSDNPNWVKQTFTRVVQPDAATANDSEPRIGIAQYDNLPPDALLAMDALGYYWSDATTSGRGNRLHGYPSQGALVDKMIKAAFSVFKPAKKLPPDNTGAHGDAEAGGAEKSAVKKTAQFTKKIPIFKINKAKQIVYGVVLAPDESDLQDDIMTADDIEETAHNYLAKSRVVGSGHEKQIEAYPVESFIAPMDFDADGQYGPQAVKKGSWILGVKVMDPKEWEKVASGGYQGFSVGGFGLRDKIA